MGLIAKTCGLVTVFAALNWAALMLFQADMRRFVDGKHMANGAGVVVALASLYLLLSLVKGRKK